MQWQDTLGRLLDTALPIAETAAKEGIKPEELFTSPLVKEARERLVSELMRDGGIEDLLAAGQRLRERHRVLVAKPELSPRELQQLGVLSGAAYALSAEALAAAVTPKAIFLYTMQMLLPWLQRAAKLALIVAQVAGGVPAGVALTDEDREGAGDPGDIEEAIGHVIVGERGVRAIAGSYHLRRSELERLATIYRSAGRNALRRLDEDPGAEPRTALGRTEQAT
jgi:hypothetical protein